MRIGVGCPIRDRAWIFPTWTEHVRSAFEVAGLKPYWIFAIGLGPNGDDGTHRLVTDLYRNEPGMWCEINEPYRDSRRQWTSERLHQMVAIRNRFLHIAQASKVDYLLSVDSDILLHPVALMSLLDTIETEHQVAGMPTHYGAVGGKTYLSKTTKHHVTYASLSRSGGLRRQDSNGVFPVEVIMALKLMTPAAYNVPYAYHQFGEDVGWSINCRRAGLKLGWDGRITSKHCMQREHLDRIDRRVGW